MCHEIGIFQNIITLPYQEYIIPDKNELASIGMRGIIMVMHFNFEQTRTQLYLF